jgi:hypothetical protein
MKTKMDKQQVSDLIQTLRAWKEEDADLLSYLYSCSRCKAEVGEKCYGKKNSHTARQDKGAQLFNHTFIESWIYDLDENFTLDTPEKVFQWIKKAPLYKKLVALELLGTQPSSFMKKVLSRDKP